MDYTAHEYLCIHWIYLTIPWYFSPISNLKIIICRLLINIHEVTVFCGVSPTYFNLFYFCESMPNIQKRQDKKGEKDEVKKLGVICGCELAVAIFCGCDMHVNPVI